MSEYSFSVRQEAWETGGWEKNHIFCILSILTSSLPGLLIFCTQEKKRRRNEEEEAPEKRQKAPSPTSLEEEEELCSDHTAVCSTKVCVWGPLLHLVTRKNVPGLMAKQSVNSAMGWGNSLNVFPSSLVVDLLLCLLVLLEAVTVPACVCFADWCESKSSLRMPGNGIKQTKRSALSFGYR